MPVSVGWQSLGTFVVEVEHWQLAENVILASPLGVR
jgi:hypothetical protein